MMINYLQVDRGPWLLNVTHSLMQCLIYRVAANCESGRYGLTTPNASLIETHVNCLNSAGRFHYFLLYEPYSVAYQNKT